MSASQVQMPELLFCSYSSAGGDTVVERGHLPPTPGDTVPSEGPYVLRNNQVLEPGRRSETGGWVKIPDSVRNSGGERGFSFRNRSPILVPFWSLWVITSLKGQEQCHTVCYGGFPQPMLSRLCVLSLKKTK